MANLFFLYGLLRFEKDSRTRQRIWRQAVLPYYCLAAVSVGVVIADNVFHLFS